jgi:ABC-type oligopeptide transport system substrate-binding subunit
VKKSIISAIALTAILSVCPILQSCSDTSSRTTYTTTSDPGYHYSNSPGYYSPSETTTTTTTTTNEPDGVVGSTGNAVGAIVAAPFEIVGDTLDAIF